MIIMESTFEGSLMTNLVCFQNRKRGYFPAVSTGWVVSKEGFWNNDSKNQLLKAKRKLGTKW
jgi:hypothetical protein